MKVIAIISTDPFISERIADAVRITKQFDVEMKMLDSMRKNKIEAHEISLKPSTEAIEKRLRESGKLTGELNDSTRHLVIIPSEDAIYLCDHETTQKE